MSAHQSELIETDIEAYLREHEQKDLLRFLTCGSVDDGKSTLIGRLLHDSKMVYEDQLAAVEADSATMGSAGEAIDLALLMDGLKAEREQGITIDVAYRYFSTSRRKFIIADTPGHEQYTRNMVTGASAADLAIILVDARHGVQVQTRRHSFIASLLGIRHVLVAINKMDLVEWSEERFDEIREEYLAFARKLDLHDLQFVPMAALLGDNVVHKSEHMAWYEGAPLMEILETIQIGDDRNLDDFRFPVQLVIRPDLTFRGYAGTVASGAVTVGDEITVLPSERRSKVSRIVTAAGDIETATVGHAVTITLEDEIDVSRGDMIVHVGDRPGVSYDVDAIVVWMTDQAMQPGRQYLFRQATQVSPASVSLLHHRIDVNTLERSDADVLDLNEIGRCTVSFEQPVIYDPYSRNKTTGAFVIVDRINNGTVGAGMIIDRDADARGPWDVGPTAEGLVRRPSQVTAAERSARYDQQAVTVLLSGLPGAGKTTIATALERRLFDLGRTTVVLDAQTMRLGLAKELGFSAHDRSENLRRGFEVAKIVNDAGIIAVCAFVAPAAEIRERARDLVGADRFVLVHVDTPLTVARERGSSALYEAADRGEAEMPGVTFEYERPEGADLTLDTSVLDVEDSVERITGLLRERGYLADRA